MVKENMTSNFIMMALSFLVAIIVVVMGAEIMEDIQGTQENQASNSVKETFNIAVSTSTNLANVDVVSGSETLVFCEHP